MTYALSTLVQSTRMTTAPAWRIALACLLDVLILAAGLGAVVTLSTLGFPNASITVAWATLAFVVWQSVSLVRLGQPFAWRLFRLRLVSQGGYPGVGLIRTRGATYAVADLMRGADPLLPVSRLASQRDTAPEPHRRSQDGRTRVQRAMDEAAGRALESPGSRGLLADAPASDTQRLRRTREAVPVQDHSSPELDERTRVNPPVSGWKPPVGVDDVREPVAEETIFAAQATPQWRVALDDTDMGPLTEPMVLGRNPAPAEGIRTVTVMDLAREVSQEHLRVTTDARGGAHVEDLGSTNGSTLVHADGISEPLARGKRYALTEGAIVQFSGHRLVVTGKAALS